MEILVYLKSLPHLSSLRVYLKSGYSKFFSDIYRMIFHLPSLKSSQLSVLTEEKLNIFIPLRKNEPFSTIERLTMSHLCDLNELHSILRHTPRLKHLTCQNLVESNQNINSEIWMTLPKLTHVSIDDCRVKFDEFENFMKKISSQLKVLHIDGYWNRNFIYPERWQRLICQYMPYLIIFKIKCHLLMNNNQFGHVYFDSFNHQLTSRLCIEREWSFILDAKPDKIFYLISSKGVCDDQKMAHHLTSQIIDRSSTSIELSVTNYSAVIWRISFIDLLNPILCSIQFTTLHLFWSRMLIGTFIKLLNQLPNLVSLKLTSSLLFPNENFDINDEDQLRINNKITKVCLWMVMKHVTTFIELCPLMEHFEVNGVKNSELISLVNFILTKTKTHILHLHSLRLYTHNADDRMVVELQKMIDREHLLFDYMIQRSDDVIALQWNLN